MRLVAFGLLLSTCWVTTPALAQDAAEGDEDRRGRIHFEAGRSYFTEGDYERAEEEFRRAHELSGHPELLMNIANSLERLGRWDEAADFMERFASEAEDVSDRPSLERRIENLRRRARGEAVEVEDDIDPVQDDPDAADAADEGGGSAKILGASISFGLAGAGLVTFAILGGLAVAERGSLEDGCGMTTSCNDDDVSGLRALSLGADIGLIVAGVGAVAGLLVLLLVDGSDNEAEATSARIAPWFGPTGGGVAVEGAL